MIWIGTSGFQYPEWKGKFYPREMSVGAMLPFYAERFQTTEINYTFYRLPSTATLKHWAAETPERFCFSLKAPRQITHVQRLQGAAPLLKHFWSVVQTLKSKLGPILFQLPPFFKRDLGVLEDFLESLPAGLRASFEFRHPSWFAENVYDALRLRNAALCIADSEKLTTPAVFTADFAYFRLRNENYTPRDIRRWTALILKQRKTETYVYFKHEARATGPRFAVQLREATGEK